VLLVKELLDVSKVLANSVSEVNDGGKMWRKDFSELLNQVKETLLFRLALETKIYYYLFLSSTAYLDFTCQKTPLKYTLQRS
jgi:hypothetical protein